MTTLTKNTALKIKPTGGMVEPKSAWSRAADIILLLLGVVAALVCVFPMWHTVMASVSDGFQLLSHKGLVLLPLGEASLDGYRMVFSDQGILTGYANTIFYVVANVGIGLVINVIGGYALSRKTKLKSFLMIFFLFPMFFGGGMTATFIIMNGLGLVNSRWAVVALECTGVGNLIFAMNAFASVPESTVESARMDGAGHFRVMFQIMLPQCMNMFLITILSSFVAAWNSWMTAAIYVPFDRTQWPLQLWIQQITADNANALQTNNPDYTKLLVEHCVIVVSTLPILIAFPFFQKKFEKGAILGAVKG